SWLEASVQVDGEAAEAVSEVFNRYGRGGAVLSTGFDDESGNTAVVTVKTYLPLDEEGLKTRRRIEEALWHLSQIYPLPPPEFRELTEDDWANAWKTHYCKRSGVLRVGQRIVIKPLWQEHEPRPDEVVIELDPSVAFGTGLHPTTRMCLRALEEHLKPGDKVLDLGTGSGILAIAAAKLGAGSVLALDNDPLAVRAARANVQSNGVQDIVTVEPGSLDKATEEFELVLINILARVIIELAAQGLMDRVRPTGLMIAAGIIEKQEGEVTAALREHEIEIVERWQEKDWVTLVGGWKLEIGG
ncbi:MAG: 50S ribosomal protein L11 methyltransferase, partial [Anaerolineae bacterium]